MNDPPAGTHHHRQPRTASLAARRERISTTETLRGESLLNPGYGVPMKR